jgi:hypothetical protein
MMRWLSDPAYRARIALFVGGLCVMGAVVVWLIAGNTAQAGILAFIALIAAPGVLLNRRLARRKANDGTAEHEG